MKNRQTEQQPITALYERLSRDDEAAGDSVSIQTQKTVLRDYAQQHGFSNCVDYPDDGYSGGNFDRPAWKQLIADIEAGMVSAVIVKDMSRVGRNYLQTGYYTEVYFPQNNVRFIAIANNVDSNDQSTAEFAPFLNIMNEWYLRDASRKQKQAYRARVKSGVPATNQVIYGYRKDPERKHHWIVDEEAAEVVRKIFRLAASGLGVQHIAETLHKEHIERPAAYMQRKGYADHEFRPSLNRPYDWNASTVSAMLKRPEYLGHSVSFRHSNISYKTKKQKENDPSDWVVLENTHEAIVDQELFDLAQRNRRTVRRVDKTGKPNILTGLVFCADCGKKMYNRRKGKSFDPATGVYKEDYYGCSTYNLTRYFTGRSCTSHAIQTRMLRGLILETIRKVTAFALKDKARFIEKIREQSKLKRASEAKDLQKKVTKAKRRVEELDRLLMKLYEDYALERIPYDRYSEYAERYEGELKALKTELAADQQSLDLYTEDTESIERFYALANRYTDLSILTDEIVLAFVDRILVHEPRMIDGERTLDVEIFLKHIGKVEIESIQETPLTAEEQAAEAEKKRKRAYHRQYYREKVKPKKEAQKAVAS
ncbi:MAG: recombinase family protein [Clostridia bacterium]|nr:recombinase family protein [Clostridia bacterium]